MVTTLAADARFRRVTDEDERARARSRYDLPDAPYVLSVATLEPRKNLAHLIECFTRVARDDGHGDLQLVLIGGEGWMMESIHAAHGASPLRDRIHFTGYVADEDLSALYSGARAFAYVSYYEGFGLPVLEAMQCGVPVIASTRAALPEVVGDAGLLVDPTDADALCQALVTLHRDAGVRRQLSERGASRVARYSWDRCAEAHVDVYRRALASA